MDGKVDVTVAHIPHKKLNFNDKFGSFPADYIVDSIVDAADRKVIDIYMPNLSWSVAYTYPIIPQFYNWKLKAFAKM